MAHFVIYAQGRTGSHLLMNLLSSHSQLECAGEVLNRERWPGAWSLARAAALRAPWLYLPRLAARAERTSWGCKVPIATSRSGLQLLHRLGWRLIHLQRRSVFDRATSWCVAHLSGRFQPVGQEQAPRLHVPAALFREQLVFRETWDVRAQQVLRGLPHLSLTYETHLADDARWQDTADLVCDHLHIAREPLTASTRKSWSGGYADIIDNYDELCAIAAETRGPSTAR
jgi:hypothetical protein